MRKVLSLILIIAVLAGCSSTRPPLDSGTAPVINVIYPKQGKTIRAVDSTFILGSVTPGSRLTVNDKLIPVHPQGGFLAYVELSEGDSLFHLEAHNQYGQTELEWPYKSVEPFKQVEPDSLAILSDFSSPRVYQELIGGDLVELSLRGTPGLQAEYKIDGLCDWTPLNELSNTVQKPESETVFGADLSMDSVIGSGIYQAGLYLPDSVTFDSSRIVYRLCRGIQDSINDTIFAECVYDTARGKLSLKKYEYPQIVELTDSTQTIRYGPRKGYLSIFQPRGIRFIADGKYNNFIRLKLAPGQTAWIPDSSIKYLPSGTPEPYSEIAYIRTFNMGDFSRVSVYLDEKLPFRVEQNPAENEIILYVYYTTADTDWIRYDPNDRFINYINWSQPQEGVYRLQIKVADSQIWGYEADYAGSTLNLDIKHAPAEKPRLKDLRIVIDPGHSSDPGSIGPTGLTEAEANLRISLEMAKVLRAKGAEVVMVREGNEHVEIYDRPKLAVKEKCDMYISVHNNALPDGVNPFENNGTSTYYYHLHSKALAEAILKRMSAELELPEYGLYHANFAVIRPTQYLDVLVECTFMILPDEEAKLRGGKFPRKCAQAIADGIEDFLKAQD